MKRAVSVLVLLASPAAWAAANQASFTPLSYLMPVRQISLNGPSAVSVLYTCPLYADAGLPNADRDAGPVDDCLVDMADNTALAALFSGMLDVAPGTYDSVNIDTCLNEGAFVVKVKGTMVLNGTTYYTTSTAATISTNAAELDYATTVVGACGGGPGGGGGNKLAAPVTINDGDSVALSAFFTLENIAYTDYFASPPLGASGCVETSGAGNAVCTGLPQLVSYLGTATPTLDTYFITEDLSDLSAAKASGQLLLFRDAAGVPFGGASRPLFSATSVPPTGDYSTPIYSITAAALVDGGVPSYAIQTYGGGGSGAYDLLFPAFELQTHTGQYLTYVNSTAPTSVPYLAVQQ